ncbi:trypsin-like peptidase domain-containing protein [Candidatus Cytomitobacter primus]|uniref:trypsin-like peptidase domain-containing protein n=1 Tax=Candidatus Cytomitobacter primus TaxID=2066024 RepID=UPI001653B7B7|nr:trypsin-like peptidase domain-containing protein [Candidatus Cytomitobacter primus]
MKKIILLSVVMSILNGANQDILVKDSHVEQDKELNLQGLLGKDTDSQKANGDFISITGEQLNQVPYAQCGRLMMYKDNESYSIGSGFLIGKNIVMTAAHNVYFRNSREIPDLIYFKSEVVNEEEQGFICVKGYVHEGWAKCFDNKYDIAILFLLNAQDMAPLVIDDSMLHNHIDISVIGFPSGCGGIMQESKGKVIRYTDHLVYHNADTLQGNSGGPVLHKNGDKWYVIAVHNAYYEYGYDGASDAPENVGSRITDNINQFLSNAIYLYSQYYENYINIGKAVYAKNVESFKNSKKIDINYQEEIDKACLLKDEALEKVKNTDRINPNYAEYLLCYIKLNDQYKKLCSEELSRVKEGVINCGEQVQAAEEKRKKQREEFIGEKEADSIEKFSPHTMEECLVQVINSLANENIGVVTILSASKLTSEPKESVSSSTTKLASEPAVTKTIALKPKKNRDSVQNLTAKPRDKKSVTPKPKKSTLQTNKPVQKSEATVPNSVKSKATVKSKPAPKSGSTVPDSVKVDVVKYVAKRNVLTKSSASAKGGALDAVKQSRGKK